MKPVKANITNLEYAAWLSRMAVNGAKRMTVDGEEWFILNETDVVLHLASINRGWQQRNGWCPCQIIEYKKPA